MPFWPGDKFSEIADWCGIVGLLVTAFLTVTATQLRQRFKHQDALKEDLAVVIDYCSRLLDVIPDYTSSGVIIEGHIAWVEGKLGRLKSNMKKNDQDTVNEVLIAIAEYRKARSEQNLVTVFSRMKKLAAELESRVRELPWEA